MNRTSLLALLAMTGCLNDGFQPYYGDDEGAPAIDSLEYYEVAGTTGGQTIEIYGSNFGSDPAALTIIFGDQNAEVVSASDTSATAILPRGPLQGGAVRVAVGSVEGQAVYDASFTYQGSASEINEVAYLHVSNDYFSCLAGLGASGNAIDPETGEVLIDETTGEPVQIGTFCDTFSYTGQMGLSGRSEYIEFPFPRMHTPYVGDKAGFAGAADQSVGAWTVMAPGQDFNTFDIQGLYEDRQLNVGSFTLTNPALAGETYCLDESLLSTYTYSGGDENPEGGVYGATSFNPSGVLDVDGTPADGEVCGEGTTMMVAADQVGFCQTPDYDDARNYQYDASWLSGKYFFADNADWASVNPRELGQPTVLLDVPGDDSGFSISNLQVVLPEYAFFEAVQGGDSTADFEGASGLYLKDDSCYDGNGDGIVDRDDPAYTFAWEPTALPPQDPSIVSVNSYIQATVSVLTAGWLGGEGVTVRAVITVPDDHNYNDSTGLSYLEMPNWVWYSLPSIYQDYGAGGFGDITWGSPFRSDYGQLFLTIDRVTEYEINVGEDEYGNARSMVFSYSTGNMGLQPLFNGDDTINKLDQGDCGDCVDQDGDGWIDSDDPDCAREETEVGFETRWECNDDRDNDRDGRTDSDDPDCLRATDREAVDVPDCDDGADNDGDGWQDFTDPDCFDDPDSSFESGYNSDLGCNNGEDDDADGWFDRDDPDCVSASVDEVGLSDSTCNDGLDNDVDGWTDVDDPDCVSATADEVGVTDSTCNDALDNDSDGWVDGLDSDCVAASDDEDGTDVSSCGDLTDDDSDGWVDAEDPDCVTGFDAEVGYGTDSCNDNIDGDTDTWTDRSDPDCITATDIESGYGPTECNDGDDNDGDLAIDNADPECDNALDTESD